VLNGTGAPASTVGNDGDFYLDNTADVLYGPKSNGTWPANGVSLAGTPGKGATVSGLAAGDANCPNGGASITDGSGNTAYACNGGFGAADLQPFVAYSSDLVTLSGNTAFLPVAGLTATVAPTSPSTYFVSATIAVQGISNQGSSFVACRVDVDGANPNGGLNSAGFVSPPPGINFDTIAYTNQIVLGAGAHTLQVVCADLSPTPVAVGTAGGSILTGFKLS
jgi:hypothetical protein